MTPERLAQIEAEIADDWPNDYESEEVRQIIAHFRERERALRELLREAQGYLNKGLNIYDEIDDALTDTPEPPQ